MKRFDALHIELRGRNLIEASAGTGKTYAIAALYLRLLVEEGLLPENILVVTFTEAATKELRDRIRQRISQARDAFAGISAGDEFIAGILARADAGSGREQGRQRLEAALQTFDCAAISTIHGFCHRALQDNAFESGSLYDTELTPLQAPLVKSLVDDFWRRSFFGVEADLLPLVESAGFDPETLTTFLKGKLSNPELEIIPRFTALESEQSEADCRDAFAAVAKMWQERQSEIRSLMMEHEGLRRSADTYRLDMLEVMLQEIDRYLLNNKTYQLCASLEKFTAGFIAGQRQKKKEPPEDPFFDLCQALFDSLQRRKLVFLWSLLSFVADALPRKKMQHNLRFYDDLLLDLLAALKNVNGAQLAAQIRGRFRAALIDEFQDTDQVQYRIFMTVFSDDTAPLFLIGDPKQAIYSFRGADIFAYLDAKRDIPPERHFTMDKNWRSTPQLVGAVNLLFSRQPERPLLFAGLDYPKVTAAREEQALALAGDDPAPLQLWFMGRDEGSSKPLDLGRARPRIVAAVAAEIAALLAAGAEGRGTIADRVIEPGDIAVIVRSHNEAGLVHDALIARDIPAVVRSNAGIFASAEAAELCTLLAALAEPAVEGKVRAALVTSLLGLSGNDIARLLEESGVAEWEEWLARFHDYHRLWQARGFMAMFLNFLAREGVRGRLLSLPNGERRLTNVLHCSELLHTEESTSRLGIDPLFTWFCHQVSSPPEGEEHQIRLESDEKAVRILTIHVSKGLEFPIVFAPFSWGGVLANEETVVCHEDNGKMVADFGSAEMSRHRQLAREESLAENLRLLYVALTRARYRCYLVWGRFRYTESAPLAYLLHAPPENPPDDILGYLAAELKDAGDAALLAPLQALAEEGKGLVTVTVNPQPPGGAPLAAAAPPLLNCRTLERKIDSGWQVSSFSSFAHGQQTLAELPDHDERRGMELRPAGDSPAEGSIFAFPRGVKAGTFLHAIFEKLDFARATEESIGALVGSALAGSSFGSKWREPLTAMVQQTVSVPLGPEGSFSLADLAPKSWLTELEFYFPLKFVGSRQLAAVLQKHAGSPEADLARLAALLDFREVQGMVRGFMDLVFCHNGRYYIVDWKSNHLGNRVEDYGQEQLSRSMLASLYPLQYLLYSVALNRYLQLRVPDYRYEEHFGGVFYLFLRGIDAARPEYGVFHDLPAPSLVEELTACLVDCEGRPEWS